MAKLTGSIDQLGRPVVRVEGALDSVLVTGDTGFNGELLMTREAARLIGADPFDDETNVELGDGRTVRLYESRATIGWLDQERRVRILVSNDWIVTGDAPGGLLGTELLAPHLLLIDFASGMVEIETQD